MYTKDVVIRNRSGLHARPASDFVSCAKGFESKITLTDPETGESVNAKSIVMLLSLGLPQGRRITLSASGADEVQAVDALVSLIDAGFGE